MKRISVVAYQALRDALSKSFWYKKELKSFLKTALRDEPRLLSPLNFTLTKREIADQLVDHLADSEDQYQLATIQLMQELASMIHYPDIEKLDQKDRDLRLPQAREATAILRSIVAEYSQTLADQEELQSQIKRQAASMEQNRRFSDELASLQQLFNNMHSTHDAQARGYAFERLLNALFALYDMEPHLAYTTGADQIDGSIRFETDDYIIEARWRSEKASRDDGDVFNQKVRRRGKNALGMFVSVKGFASTFIDEFSKSTSFITMDGSDLFAVLDSRIRLDEVIRAKKRYANDTGSCYFPVSKLTSTTSD